MHYTIYRVTNKVNGKIYVGSHKTKNLDDGYMGSGKYLRRSIEKNGIETFEKEILFVFDNPEEMFAKEAEIVDEDFIAEQNTYNLKVGGFGGFDYVNSIRNHKRHNANIAKQRKYADTDWGCNRDLEKRKAQSLFMKKRYEYGLHNPNTFEGRSHKEETKQIMSDKAKQRLSDPTRNSQYGTMWITNGVINKKIKKGVDIIPEGWYNGRVTGT